MSKDDIRDEAQDAAAKLAKAMGKRLKDLREGAGESQEDLARAVDVSVGSISRWERGVDSPRAMQVVLLAEHFQTTADHILLGVPQGNLAPNNKAFQAFAATPLGIIAQEHKLVRTLLAMTEKWPRTPTVRTYEVLTTVLLQGEQEDEERK